MNHPDQPKHKYPVNSKVINPTGQTCVVIELIPSATGSGHPIYRVRNQDASMGAWSEDGLTLLGEIPLPVVQEPPDSPDKIGVGDSVKLKSGGPSMTVIDINANVAQLIWLNDHADIARAGIPLVALEKSS